MKKQLKRFSKSTLSIVLTLCMLISCMTVGLITTDAAQADGNVGDNGVVVKGSWKEDSQTWVPHTITDGQFSIHLDANTVYSFVFLKDGTQYAKNTTISESKTDYYVSADSNASFKLQTSVAGEYVFKHTGYDGGGTSLKIAIEFPNVQEDPKNVIWTVTGNNANLFTKTWNTGSDSFKANDMTYVESTKTYTWTKSNVYLAKGDIEYKIVKSHAWSPSVPSGSANQKETVSTAGYYNVTVTYDGTTLSMNLTPAAKYTLNVQAVEHATVTATYGSTTVSEGGTISDIPSGANITVNVTPDSKYKCTGVTATYDTNQQAEVTPSANKYTFAMPAGNTQVTAAIAEYQGTLRTIYFYNKSTAYPMVTAYVYYKENDVIKEEVFGAGKTMTKMENSDMWYIENVPSDAKIVFKGDGYDTGELTQDESSTKYTPGSDRTQPGKGGTWGEYKERNNIYTVSKGDNMNQSGIFTGINATFYDYYVDNEAKAGGNWLTGITAKNDYISEEYTNDPYRQYLNKALSDYASSNSTSYPLYWGNNKSKNNGSDVANVSTTATDANYLYGFNQRANNSDGLYPNATAIQGLAGNTLAGGTIHHYESTDTNKNGAPMAFFDEDFLSGENTKATALATILHSTAFPVRRQNVRTIYFDAGNITWWKNDSCTIYAHFWKYGTSASLNVAGTNDSGVFSFNVPSGYDRVLFYRAATLDGNILAKTPDLTITSDKNLYTAGGSGDGNAAFSGSWSEKSDTTVNGTHTYYEYNSTNGIDNAFITNIDTANKTANLSYYTDKHVKSQNGTIGFFPFDYNNVISAPYDVKKVYLDLNNIWNTSDNAVFYAYFIGVSASEQWKSMSKDSTNYYSCLIPSGATGVIFVRQNSQGTDFPSWSSKYNQTEDLSIPTNQNVIYKITGWENGADKKSGGEWKSDDNVIVERKTTTTNGYAASDQVAHDQGFGTKIEIPFTLNKNGLNTDGTAQTFEFSGDDDLWVYIDNKLVLDLGGAHARTTGSINFNTMKAVADTAAAVDSGNGGSKVYDFNSIVNTKADNFDPDKVHTMTIYYMERGMFDSNLKFGFSFHAIPNQFQAEKKVRTRSETPTGSINGGFFYDNKLTGTASNMSGTYIDNGERRITKFEDSFQSDTFNITQTFTGTHSSIKYSSTKGGTQNVTPDGKTFNYTLQNNNDGENILYFNGQFAKDETFTIKEEMGTGNKYNYVPYFVARDEAQNSKVFTVVEDSNPGTGEVSGNNTDGFKFNFTPLHDAQNGIDDIRIRARFENVMKNHSLTLKKLVNDDSDTESEFTFEIKFKFDDDSSTPYISYPLEIDGTEDKVGNDGTITIKAGQSITLSGIPENAKIQLRELSGANTYAFKEIKVKNEDGSEVTAQNSEGSQGVVFTMGEQNQTAEVYNTTGEPVLISHSLHPQSLGDANCYVTAYVKNSITDEDKDAVETYPITGGMIEVDKQYITYNSNRLLEIKLETVALDNSNMEGFFEQIVKNSMQALKSTSGTPKYTATYNVDTGTATIWIEIKDLFNSETHQQLYTELPFYSKLGLLKNVSITKDIDNDDNLKVLENVYTNFPIRIQISTDDGQTFADYQGDALTGTDVNNHPITASRAQYKDTNNNWFFVHSIRQKDILNLNAVKPGWKIKISEVTAEEIQEGSGVGQRELFQTTFKEALDNYQFKNSFVKNHGEASTIAENTPNTQVVTFTVAADKDTDVTITNEAILYTVIVKKEYSDQTFPDDGSTFELTVTYNPSGSTTGGTYHPVENGTVSDTIQGGKTGTDGVYTVKKDTTITFNNIPKGTYFKVQETAINNSPVTGSVRFELDTMVLSKGTLTTDNTARYFNVTGDGDGKTVTLTVKNKVKMYWTDITKVVTDTGDDNTKHKIKVDVQYSQNGEYLQSVDYRTIQSSSAATTTVSRGNTIDIVKGGHVWLLYPIGSYITVEEVQPGENDYEIQSISVTGHAGTATYSRTAGTVDNKVTFQTEDNSIATVTITNQKVPDIGYQIIYQFPSRSRVIDDNNGKAGTPKYGELKYTVTGTGKPAEILENGAIQKSLIQKNVPYEKNFMQNMKWKFDEVSETTKSVADGKTIYSVTVNAENEDLPTVDVLFYFPYASKSYVIRDNDNSIDTNPEKGIIYGPDGNPTRLIDYTTQRYDNQVYQSNPVVYAKRTRTVADGNGGTKTEEYDEKFSTFAADSVDGHKFAYWSIRSLDRNNPRKNDAPNYVEVARCYEAKFNYTLFDNYRVYAMYTGQEDVNGNTITEIAPAEKANTYINFLEYSRNHWNNSDNGGYPDREVGDAVWSDFDVAFEYQNKLISGNSSTIEAGVLIERVQDSLDDGYSLNPADANYDANYRYYVNKYAEKASEWRGAAEAVINKSTFNGETYRDTADTEKYVKNVLTTQLTNKNRMEFGFALFVDKGGSKTPKVSEAKMKGLYRAYSYLRVLIGTDENGNNLYKTILCEKPAYFCVQAEALKNSSDVVTN